LVVIQDLYIFIVFIVIIAKESKEKTGKKEKGCVSKTFVLGEERETKDPKPEV